MSHSFEPLARWAPVFLRQRLLWCLALIVPAASGCGYGERTAPGPPGAVAAKAAGLMLPALPTGEFSGSAACTRCHAAEAEKYHGHPMAASLAEIRLASSIESYDNTEFSPLPGLTYFVERTSDGVLHHEKRTDSDGNVIYDQAFPVSFAVGSGTRGRTYLINDDGRLFASPISWFTGPAKWDLSPGYQPQSNPRFERRVSEACIACHAGAAVRRTLEPDRFAEVPFLEAGIGCERCHGPGKAHVDHHAGPRPGEGPDPIFNPSRVHDARRDAVCNQCHLQGRRRVTRYGRSEFDFRPGMSLSDNWVIFLKTAGVESGAAAAAVSQVEQVYSSRCFQQTGGALACITCHNGHGVPGADQKVAVYRAQCVNCHSGGRIECSESLDRRVAVTAEDSCIVCHMPRVPASDVHAAQTDHRILKRPPPPDAAPAPHELLRDARPVLFKEPGVQIPVAELNRARGIFLAEQAAAGGSSTQARQALDLLLPLVPQAPEDFEGRYALGRAFQSLQQPELAIHVWQQVLELRPKHEEALEALAIQYHESGNLAAAQNCYEQLVEINPSRSHYLGRLAHVLGQQGELTRGIEMAERCLRQNPALVQTHAWLAEAYRKSGNPQRAVEHEEKLRQFKSLSNPAPAAQP